MTVTIGGARPRSDRGPQSYPVDVWMGRDGEVDNQQLLVVEEDGSFCVGSSS